MFFFGTDELGQAFVETIIAAVEPSKLTSVFIFLLLFISFFAK